MGRLKLTYQTGKSNTKSSILLTCSLLLLLHQRQLRCRLEVKRPNVKTYLPNHHSINILEQLSWLDIRTLWLWVIKIFQRSNDHLECSVQICSMPCIEPWMDEWLTYLVTDRNFKWRHLGFWESALALSLSAGVDSLTLEMRYYDIVENWQKTRSCENERTTRTTAKSHSN